MEHFDIDLSKKYDYENGFYLTSDIGRVGKLLNQYEIYKLLSKVSGDICEFGVYKGSSLSRLLTFRQLLEDSAERRVFGFDAFGKFPSNVSSRQDQDFISSFEKSGGFGISKARLNQLLELKGIKNYELIQGDIKRTLPQFLINKPETQIALAHIDVDVFEVTELILDLIWPRIVTSGIIMLDDYNIVEGATKAINKFITTHNLKVISSNFYKSPSYIIKS